MASLEPLTQAQVADALADLPGWEHADDKLRKTFRFANFQEAISFIVRLAFDAEALNHHPELYNVYNTVEVALTTHDAGNKVTKMDVALALALERFSWV